MISKFPKTRVGTGPWSLLQAELQGAVIGPEDPRYNAARRSWNLAVEQRPAVIVAPQNAADVTKVVRFACAEGLGVAVQATGHGTVRPANGCMLILTAGMQGVMVDAATRTATIEAGVKWGKALEKTQAVGLAPLLGSSSDVGAVGYTLGGGLGWLARKYGLSADSVIRFKVVTANGELLPVSDNENSDLFWGLRGGGGSLAIVTEMEIKLYPVTTVYGGNLIYPIEQAREVMTHYRAWLSAVPDELTSSLVLMNFSPMPDVPEFLRGKSFVMVRGAYCGPVAQGKALLNYWRSWRAPLVDDFKAMPFSQVASISNDPVEPMAALTSSAWLRELSDEAIDIMINRSNPAQGSPLAFLEIRHAGGAVARLQASVYSNRDDVLNMQMVGAIFSPEGYDALKNYYAETKQALRPYLSGRVYLNFLEGDESQVQIKNGFSPEAYQRLTELKAQYDPQNILGYGFNIKPVH